MRPYRRGRRRTARRLPIRQGRHHDKPGRRQDRTQSRLTCIEYFRQTTIPRLQRKRGACCLLWHRRQYLQVRQAVGKHRIMTSGVCDPVRMSASELTGSGPQGRVTRDGQDCINVELPIVCFSFSVPSSLLCLHVFLPFAIVLCIIVQLERTQLGFLTTTTKIRCNVAHYRFQSPMSQAPYSLAILLKRRQQPKEGYTPFHHETAPIARTPARNLPWYRMIRKGWISGEGELHMSSLFDTPKSMALTTYR